MKDESLTVGPVLKYHDVESVVSGIRDLKSTTPPDHFKVYSEALIELLEKHKT